MGIASVKPSRRLPVVAMIASADHAVGSVSVNTAVDMGRYLNAMLVLAVGEFGEAATASVKWQQSQSGDFSSPKDIEGRAEVELSAGVPVQLNLSALELDLNNGYRYVRPVITIGTKPVQLGGVVLGVDARDNPCEPLATTIVD